MKKKILLIDPVGRTRGMERWHQNFFALTSKVFRVEIFGNYDSDFVRQKFIYDKDKKGASLRSIFSFAFARLPKDADRVVLAHYGESLNTLLFLPAILRYKRNQRFLLIHDAVSTLKNERKGIRSKMGHFANKLLMKAFDNLIVHNKSVSELFPGKSVTFLPLPPAISSHAAVKVPATGSYIFWGFIKRSKNVEFVIDLASRMPEKTFDVYGTFINEEYKAAFNERVKTLEVKNLRFYEFFIPESEVDEVLSRYDAVLMPYTFITNSGILQTNADYCAVSVTSDLAAFKVCSDISINLPLEVEIWKDWLASLDSERLLAEKTRITLGNEKRASDFIEGLKQLG
ncbi:MAG: hypothetical protein ABW007_13210 [Chitinophagaceae bacterium]